MQDGEGLPPVPQLGIWNEETVNSPEPDAIVALWQSWEPMPQVGENIMLFMPSHPEEPHLYRVTARFHQLTPRSTSEVPRLERPLMPHERAWVLEVTLLVRRLGPSEDSKSTHLQLVRSRSK